MDQKLGMLNRRHLRIKILQMLYAFVQAETEDLEKGEKELLKSIDKMYDMYLLYMLSFENLTRIAENRLEDAKRKIRPTEEDLNPNMHFVNNKLIKQLEQNIHLHKAANDCKVSWGNDIEQDLLKKLFLHIKETEDYTSYMENREADFIIDRQFAVRIFKKEICNFELIHHYLDEKSVYWQDDIDHVASMVIKTLKLFTENSDEFQPILELYKDDEKEFTKELFRKTLNNFEKDAEIIEEYVKNWEADRLAKMDLFLLHLALNEAIHFDQIPLKVTLNEYIEISKYYSTPKSNGFINGVLDKLFADLNKQGKIKKIGRGLLK